MDEKEVEAIGEGVSEAMARHLAGVLDVTATLFEHLVKALHHIGALSQAEIDDLISGIERENDSLLEESEHRPGVEYLQTMIPRLRDRLRQR